MKLDKKTLEAAEECVQMQSITFSVFRSLLHLNKSDAEKIIGTLEKIKVIKQVDMEEYEALISKDKLEDYLYSKGYISESKVQREKRENKELDELLNFNTKEEDKLEMEIIPSEEEAVKKDKLGSTSHIELEKLIDAALADNKLTTKEMEVLVKKAKKLGIDEDEFLIELDGKRHRKKKLRRDNFLKTISGYWKIWAGALLILMFTLIIAFYPTKSRQLKKLRSNFFTSIEKRDFEKAYLYLTELKTLRGSSRAFYYHTELLRIRIPYLLENDAPDVALSELSELVLPRMISDNIKIRNEMIMLIGIHTIKNQNFKLTSEVLSKFLFYETEFLGIGLTETTREPEGNVIDYNEEVMEYNRKILYAMAEIVNDGNRSECVQYFKLWAKAPYKMEPFPRKKDYSVIDKLIMEI